MIRKQPVCPHRIRKVPSQFSWLDHRLVRDRHIESITHPAAALYLLPVYMLIITGMAFSMLGFALDRIFNPRLRQI